MSKSPFSFEGMSTNINLNRVGGNFSFSKESLARKRARAGARALRYQDMMKRNAQPKSFLNTTGPFSAFFGSQPQQPTNQVVPEENTSSGAVGAISQAAGVVDNSIAEVKDQAQVTGSMPEASSSLVNPFGLQAQGAIGGTFGSLFDRQNSMGSALQKRACKYKNKK